MHDWYFECSGERRKRGKTDRRSTELSTIIRNCLEQTILLELMPSSQIDVYVQVLQVSFEFHQMLCTQYRAHAPFVGSSHSVRLPALCPFVCKALLPGLLSYNV